MTQPGALHRIELIMVNLTRQYRLVVHIRSRDMGVRRGSAQDGHPEQIQLHLLLQTKRLARISSAKEDE